MVYRQRAIKEVFYEHLCEMYTEQLCPSSEALEGFLLEVYLLSLDSDSRESLEAHLSKEEVLAAIRHLKPAKTPGSDGLPVEFYHRYAEDLADQLLVVYGEALNAISLLAPMQEMMVGMVLKPGREPESA
ncbi:hypothetical protein NDU88_000800 [Pleurodeles waltl]|uniref:Uncharacterized protein n=1 Tax=Pleurodeles waltl TaxID=8319 RepID=A0AAV7WKC2_PLEWA|nr:hypothetical protein NDU88_000800 [Pleurodeles waltl]